MTKKNKTLFLLFAIGLFLLSAVFLVKYIKQANDEIETRSAQQANERILRQVISKTEKQQNQKGKKQNRTEDENKEEPVDEVELSNELLDRLNKENKTENIIAYIDTGEGGIREVVGYRADSDYFDRRNIRGEYDFNGTVFLYQKNNSPMDPYTNYFAHNVYSGERFYKLSKYEIYAKYLQNATVYTREGILRYDLVHVSVVESSRYDQFATWQKDGLASFFQDRDQELMNLFHKEDFQADAQYMLWHTCLDDEGEYKVIAIFKRRKIL